MQDNKKNIKLILEIFNSLSSKYSEAQNLIVKGMSSVKDYSNNDSLDSAQKLNSIVNESKTLIKALRNFWIPDFNKLLESMLLDLENIKILEPTYQKPETITLKGISYMTGNIYKGSKDYFICTRPGYIVYLKELKEEGIDITVESLQRHEQDISESNTELFYAQEIPEYQITYEYMAELLNDFVLNILYGE